MEEVEQSAGEVEEAEDRAEESVVEGNGVEGEEEKEDEEESGGGMEKAVWASHTNWEVAWGEPTQDREMEDVRNATYMRPREQRCRRMSCSKALR